MATSTGEALSPRSQARWRTSSTTESISAGGCPRVNITASGNTLTFRELKPTTIVQVDNQSAGDAYLNHAIILQNTTYSAPVTIPTGDKYTLHWDSTANAFRF